MRYLDITEILEIYQRVMEQSGGLIGIRDFGALESAAAQPFVTFDGKELYPTLIEKAGALGFSLIQNHPFIAGHAAMAMFLSINGYQIHASIDEQAEIILSVASGNLNREGFTKWLVSHV
jgi:death-on-curing protein